MRRFSRGTLFRAAILFAVFGMFSGCSGGREDSLARVKKVGYISFAMSGGFPPFSFYDQKHNLIGFDVDVSKEVAKRLGVELKVVDTEWKEIIQGLKSGAYDGILGSMSVTEDRGAMVAFSVSYYYTRSRLMVNKHSSYTSPEDLKGKRVGIVAGTTFEEDARALGMTNIRLYKDNDQALLGLHNKVVDGVISDEIMAMYAQNRKNLDIVPLGHPLRTEKIAVAFRKGEDSLLQEVNKILEDIQKDGTLRRLAEKMVKNEYQ